MDIEATLKAKVFGSEQPPVIDIEKMAQFFGISKIEAITAVKLYESKLIATKFIIKNG